jgi:hypothetical protein
MTTGRLDFSPLNTIRLLVCLVVLAVGAQAQKPSQTKPPSSDDDIVRVKIELVQTDVNVVDKRGQPEEGLSPDQFQLRVNGKSQPVLFFDQITTGAAREEEQLRAAPNMKPGIAAPPAANAAAARGRVIFFFVDDVHLAGDSLSRARSLLTRFVENKMTAGDRVAIVSTSGQIGFLQQLTDNRSVLREAISRIQSKYNPEPSSSTSTPEDELRSALGSLYPRGDLPTSVSATVSKTAKGTELAILMQLDSGMLNFENGEKQTAMVDVLGIALDDRGLFSSFKQRLDIPRTAVTETNPYVKWTQTLTLPAGIYQVRVAVRDRQTARTGGAMLWIEIPTSTTGR